MRKVTFKNIVVCVLLYIVLAIFPQLCNLAIETMNQCLNWNILFRIDSDGWFNFISIAVPSTLTYFVIKQSDAQQEENNYMQNRMEKISARMLELELRDKIGYLRPYFSLKDAGVGDSHRQPYPYRLSKYITLVNSGDADLFIISISLVANGKPHIIPCDTPLFVSKQSPFNEFCLETKNLLGELSGTQIDMTIEFVLRNIKGFQYKQILFLGFENREEIGQLNKFNVEIQEAK